MLFVSVSVFLKRNLAYSVQINERKSDLYKLRSSILKCQNILDRTTIFNVDGSVKIFTNIIRTHIIMHGLGKSNRVKMFAWSLRLDQHVEIFRFDKSMMTMGSSGRKKNPDQHGHLEGWINTTAAVKVKASIQQENGRFSRIYCGMFFLKVFFLPISIPNCWSGRNLHDSIKL